ncbi:translation initiation factor IF-3 [Patescibacteria group bacterium]
MAKRRYQKPQRTFYRINHFIQAGEVRVVDEDGKQVGLMPLSQALGKAREKGLDLVEVAPKAKPPVCKIINFKKFKYLESKKRQAEKKKLKKIELKEIRLTPFIAENDLKFRLEKARKFLKEGDRAKISIFFRGREMTKKEFGYQLIKKSLEKLEDCAKVEVEPKFIGRRLQIILSPIKKEKNEQTKAKDQKISQKKV